MIHFKCFYQRDKFVFLKQEPVVVVGPIVVVGSVVVGLVVVVGPVVVEPVMKFVHFLIFLIALSF